MSRIHFCLITPFEAEQIKLGLDISCRDHRHISRNEALRLIGGGKHRGWLEESEELRKRQQITFNYHPIADWAMMPDGSESQRHIVLRHAREWRQKNGSMQLVPLGMQGRSTGNRYKVHCKEPRAPYCKVIKQGVNISD
jgi:hypothetical protein